jgi:hypothetical protein
VAGQLTVQLVEDDADDARLDTVTRYLREELLRLDVNAVPALSGAEAPEGSRGLDVIALGSLVVSLGGSQTVRTVVTAVRAWLRRSPEVPRTVRVEMDGDVLELSGASSADQERLVELFVARHAQPTEPAEPAGP